MRSDDKSLRSKNDSEQSTVRLEQGFPTYGPRAGSGPSNFLNRPAKLTDNIIYLSIVFPIKRKIISIFSSNYLCEQTFLRF